MAIVKAVTSFLRNHGKSRFPLRCMCSGNRKSRDFPFPLQPTLSHPAFVPSVPLYVHRLSSSRSLFPLSGWMSMSRPLFLLSPAWRLSQTATPVYLRGGEAIFPQDLLQERLAPIISKSYSDILNGGGWKITVEEETIILNERFLNLPNMISIGRMVSGPVIGWMIINEFYLYAFCGLAISGATDWLDGFVARKMNINSVIGSYLDPLADKVLVGCVVVAMVKKDLLNPGLVGLILSRDIALVGGAAFKRASTLGWNWRSWSDFANLDDAHKEKVEPLLISKINTVLQLLLVAVALLQPEFGSDETNLQLTYLSWLVASTTVASFAAYMKQYLYGRK